MEFGQQVTYWTLRWYGSVTYHFNDVRNIFGAAPEHLPGLFPILWDCYYNGCEEAIRITSIGRGPRFNVQ